MTIPVRPKIYHIIHVDRLASIIQSGGLSCDAEMMKYSGAGTTIGMSNIKQRRLNELTLDCYPDLHVGACVPFYFCPRSVMLYVISQANHSELAYKGGQEPIIHLEFDLYSAVQWANASNHRWAFTLSNAGSYFFEDRCDLNNLNELNWEAIQANQWSKSSIKEGKQAEFLVEKSFPWRLIEKVGVQNQITYTQAARAVNSSAHKPLIEIKREWYY